MVDRMANMPTALLRIQQMLCLALHTKGDFHRGISLIREEITMISKLSDPKPSDTDVEKS
jgi:hypothetical protein